MDYIQKSQVDKRLDKQKQKWKYHDIASSRSIQSQCMPKYSKYFRVINLFELCRIVDEKDSFIYYKKQKPKDKLTE